MSWSGLFLAATPSPSPTPSAFGAGVINFSILLSLVVWTPVVVAVVMAMLPNPRGRWNRHFQLTAFWTSAAVLALAAAAYWQFQPFASGLSYGEHYGWMPVLGIGYHLGLDGMSAATLLLSTIVGLVAVVASFSVRQRARAYWVLLLLAEAAVNGAVAAQDFFLFSMFWVAAIVPLALLVRGWGGPEGEGAANRLALYWGGGSALLLAAGFALWSATGSVGFDFGQLMTFSPSSRVQVVVGLLIMGAAATRMPIFPLHRWAPSVLSEAPLGVAILIAGSASRLGGYLLLRFLAQTDQSAALLLAPFLALLAAATVVWAAWLALQSSDARRLGAWLALVPGAVTTLGIAGLSPLSLEGAVLSLFSGGVAAALFVAASGTLAQRAQSRDLNLVAGLAARMPRISWVLLMGSLFLLGLPFAATFPATVMIVLGSFRNQPWWTFAVVAGVVLAAFAVAWLVHRVLFGEPHPEAPSPQDSSLSESWFLGVLAGALLWVGLFPLGPRLAGIPLFDPGMLNVVNAINTTLAGTYAVPTPPTAPSPSPAAPSPSAPTSPAASPQVSPSP